MRSGRPFSVNRLIGKSSVLPEDQRFEPHLVDSRGWQEVPTWNPRCRLRNASIMGSRGWSPTAMIRQGCFQSFIKSIRPDHGRIVKILWTIIAIPKKGAFQKLPSQADCVKKFPPCLRPARRDYAQAGIKLSQHPCRITATDSGGIARLLLI
jgi:hypothetical protein